VGRNTRIALAVGIGYLLGRRRKLRAALVLGAAAAAGRLSSDPQALRRLLPSGPQLGQVAGLGKPLTEAGKAAAAAAVSHGIDSVGDRLRRQADVLRGAGIPGGGPEPERGEERDLAKERDRAEGRRGGRVRTAPPEDYEREHHDYEEGRPDYAEEQPEEEQPEEEQPEEERPAEERPAEEQRPEPQPEPMARRRKKAPGRAAVPGRPRKRTAEEEGAEAAQQPSRRAGRERPETGGAPVRRRGRRES
jgi:hypothetical protein